MIEKMQLNMSSKISLTLGILSIFVPFFGLILGVLGIVFSKKAKKVMLVSDEGGKGLATFGFIFSLFGIVIQLIALLAYFLYTSVTR